ncbi:hypothetical protein PVAP13_5NG444640 [Panicum virgatum]|uniref:Uncharacterized protein n=1 Tax=Panicum virgatum TaxID=38727 RepID=A0A8T0S2W2_PANVG|nr:hypothetical protein PVAP13_5NG444640 [Panicum virgatum]
MDPRVRFFYYSISLSVLPRALPSLFLCASLAGAPSSPPIAGALSRPDRGGRGEHASGRSRPTPSRTALPPPGPRGARSARARPTPPSPLWPAAMTGGGLELGTRARPSSSLARIRPGRCAPPALDPRAAAAGFGAAAWPHPGGGGPRGGADRGRPTRARRRRPLGPSPSGGAMAGVEERRRGHGEHGGAAAARLGSAPAALRSGLPRRASFSLVRGTTTMAGSSSGLPRCAASSLVRGTATMAGLELRPPSSRLLLQILLPPISYLPRRPWRARSVAPRRPPPRTATAGASGMEHPPTSRRRRGSGASSSPSCCSLSDEQVAGAGVSRVRSRRRRAGEARGTGGSGAMPRQRPGAVEGGAVGGSPSRRDGRRWPPAWRGGGRARATGDRCELARERSAAMGPLPPWPGCGPPPSR